MVVFHPAIANALPPGADTCFAALLAPTTDDEQRAACYEQLGPERIAHWMGGLPIDTSTCRQLQRLGRVLHDNDPQGSLRISLTVLSKAKEAEAGHRLLADLEHDVAYACQALGKHADALKHFTECAAFCERMGNRYDLAECQYYIGNIFSDLGDTSRAIAHMARYMELADSIGKAGQRIEALRSMAAALHRFGEHRKALEHLHRAHALAIAASDEVETGLTQLDKGSIHHDMGDHDMAMAAFQKAAIHLEKPRSLMFLIHVHERMARILSEQERTLEALAMYHNMLDEARSQSSLSFIAKAQLGISNVLLHMGRIGEARTRAEEALNTATGAGILALRAEALTLLIALHRTSGNHRSALTYSDSLLACKDSVEAVQGKEEAARIAARTEYELALAKGSLANEQAQARMDAELARARAIRITLVVLMGALIAVSLLLVNRYRLKRRLQVEQLRTRLSRDLHDDIGSTLSSISILSNVVKKRAEASGDTDTVTSLNKISDRSQRLLRNMSDIVWSVDPKKDTLEELIARMREFAASVLEDKGIAYTLDLPVEVPAITLAAETKNNIYLIFKEAVNNVVKHAEAKNVTVRIAVEAGTLTLEVIDDGVGIGDRATMNGHGGNGLSNMRERAKELKARLRSDPTASSGTTVRLDIALD